MTKAHLVLLAALVAAGCGTPLPAATTPSAAVTPTVLPTPTSAAASAGAEAAKPLATAPTAAPTAAATLAPTIPDGLSLPDRAAFAEARLLLVEGDYTGAAERWRHLLTIPADGVEARFSLALALALAGRGPDALQVLSTGGPDSREAFVRGLALDAANQHSPAMQSLASYAATNPLVAPAVWLEIAERELNARRPREAADAAASALDTAQGRPLKQRLLEVRGEALAQLGDNEAAFDSHRQVLALATSTATLGEQLFRLAQVSRDLGKPDAALQALKTALDQFPSASTTADALRLLDELGAANQIDPFVLGRARYFAVDYRNAVTAFDQYLQADPNGPDVPAARLYKALASLTPGNEPNALRELDALADDPDQETEIAAQALVEAGQALEGLSEPDQAEARYQKLIDKLPRLDAAATAGFRLGLVRYVRGADNEAIAAWDALIARRDDLSADDVSRAFYWRARALSRLGRDGDARSSLEQAAALRPSSYYSLRAALQVTPAAAQPISPQVTPEDEQQLARWMAARNQELGAAASTVASDRAWASSARVTGKPTSCSSATPIALTACMCWHDASRTWVSRAVRHAWGRQPLPPRPSRHPRTRRQRCSRPPFRARSQICRMPPPRAMGSTRCSWIQRSATPVASTRGQKALPLALAGWPRPVRCTSKKRPTRCTSVQLISFERCRRSTSTPG